MYIRTKKEMYEKLLAGEFGNTARSWLTYEALMASGYDGLVGVRSLEPGGAFRPYVPVSEVVPATAVMYSEMQKDEHILLQGEAYRSVEGLYLFASHEQTHMRPALRNSGKHYWRLQAYAELEAALWPTDFDELMNLLADYPDSVVEFSAYSREVGTVPHRNTIIWEVRNY